MRTGSVTARRLARWLWVPLVILVAAAAAIAVGLTVTPMQTVDVAGQVVKVGTTTPGWDLSGPGEVDLFGQSLPTQLTFTGPVRPRLQLTHISINSELTNFVQGTSATGAERRLGHKLADGWTRYFIWETVIVGMSALVILGAVAGWQRLPRRRTIALLAGGLAVTQAINLGAIMITAYRAPQQLRQVRSLNQLVGNTAPVPDPVPSGKPLPGVQAVVLGDSTAAGAGLPLARHASRADRLCGRSADSYAADLATANNWQVLNLACDSATIDAGLLGPQARHGQMVPPQMRGAQRAADATVVIVSVGADDLDWSAMVMLCAASPRCNDRASAAYFQQQLASFSRNYLQLLNQLAGLPGRPHVIVNQYYNPFGLQDCLSRDGLTPGKIKTLTDRLTTLNTVLAKGSEQFGFTSVRPDFTGHELCTAQPYVQGPGAVAPFHPTAAGQLAIALADQAVLRQAGQIKPG